MEEKKEPEACNPEETGACARVLRELLRTPAVKDLIALGTGDDERPETARELARVLLWEDAVFSFGVLGSLPGRLNFLAVFLGELGRQLQNVPPHLMREFVSAMVENIDSESIRSLPAAYAPLLNTLLREDPAMRQRLRDGAVETLNSLFRLSARALDGLAREPGETAGGSAAQERRSLDPQALGDLINALCDWLGRAAGEDPSAILARQERKSALIQETVRSIDFGKVRSAVTRRMEAGYPVMESLVSNIVSDPVIFANLVNILPPLLNHLLKMISGTLAKIDFPPEILASAVFNLLDDLEAEELGNIVNGLSGLINSLHRGSMVLGRTEPRFRPVLQNLLEKAVRNIDENAAGDALLALFEDLEVVLRVSADVAVAKPELTASGFSSLTLGFNAVLRGLAYTLESFNRLPPHLYEHFAREMEKKDFSELGNLFAGAVKLANRVLDENPALVRNALASLYRSLDRVELQKLASLLLREGAAFAANENIFCFLQPEEAGKVLNPLLVSYNRKLEQEPRAAGDSISRYLEQLDSEELSRALANTAGGLSRALAANPQLSRSLIKSFFAVFRGALRGSLRRKKKNRQTAPPREKRAGTGRRG